MALKLMLTQMHPAPAQVELAFVTNEEIQKLNREFRSKDVATDVLSFPSNGFHHEPLGEVVISTEYAETQARARGKSFDSEVVTLALHGTLHLLGFDDHAPDERALMIELQNQFLVQTGFEADPDWQSLQGEALP